MSAQNYSRVLLLTDAYTDEGVFSGSVGYVIEVYPGDKYEVEFSGVDGVTVAQLVLFGDEITVAD